MLSSKLKKMKTIYSIIFIITGLFGNLNAQSLINQGAFIRINPGSSLYIDGNFQNTLNGNITNSGHLLIRGNWINNAVSGNLLQGTTGTVFFNGSSVQNIAGTKQTWFSNLNLQNNSALAVNTSVSSALTLENNSINLGTYNLTIEENAMINDASPSGYIIASGNGSLIRNQVGNADTEFPVGTSSDFVPVVLNNAGIADNFAVNVFADVRVNGLNGPTVSQIDDCVNMTWNITEGNAGGSDLSVTSYWSANIEGASFDGTLCGIGQYSGGVWNPQEAMAANGSNLYFITRTGINSPGSFAVGDPQSPLAIPYHIVLDMNVLLEGPYSSSFMMTSLNSTGYLPLSQPFNVSPWNYAGTETVSSIPNPDIVDWLLVDSRDAVDAISAGPETTIDRQAAFILKDGYVVGMDGYSNLTFSKAVKNQLFVVIWHKNHLGIMSANPLSGIGGNYSYNFKSDINQAFGINAQKDLGTGEYAMFAGDANLDGKVDASDITEGWVPKAGTSGYKNGDANLDTQVDNKDKNDFIIVNIGQSSQVPVSSTFVCGGLFVDDRDGQYYSTTQIGTQCWMARNLNIGTMIPSTETATDNDTVQKYCYDNDPGNCDYYGGLYTWHEMMQYVEDESTQGICPTGWHLPSDAEFCAMENTVDTASVACDVIGWRGSIGGLNLKATFGWNNDGNGTGLYGFDALPHGFINTANQNMNYITGRSFFWTTTIHSYAGHEAYGRRLDWNNNAEARTRSGFRFAFSVRCMKD